MKTGVMRASGALRHIEHLETLSLDPYIAIPEMLRTLHDVVPDAAQASTGSIKAARCSTRTFLKL